MKTFWCFLFLSIALVSGRAIVNVSQEFTGDILKTAVDCTDSSGAGVDALQKMASANFEDTEPFKKFLYCFASNSGYVDSDGHFIMDKMTKLIGNHKDKAKYVDAINLCNKRKGGRTIDTIYELANCFKDHSPIYFTL